MPLGQIQRGGCHEMRPHTNVIRLIGSSHRLIGETKKNHNSDGILFHFGFCIPVKCAGGVLRFN